MKKTVLASAVALALTAGLSGPAHAGNNDHKEWIELNSMSQAVTRPVEASEEPKEEPTEFDKFVADPVEYLIGLLLPAVQK